MSHTRLEAVWMHCMHPSTEGPAMYRPDVACELSISSGLGLGSHAVSMNERALDGEM